MTIAIPSKLPPCFNWKIEDGECHRLYLEEVSVLEVRRQRGGWIVRVHLTDSVPQPDVAVRSVADGMRWGARWSKRRAYQLGSLVAKSNGHLRASIIPDGVIS